MTDDAPSGKSYFEQQRELLVGDVAASLENVLQNINKLNRSLEGVIALTDIITQVGNEFSQVEGLWSQFEQVMAKAPEEPKEGSKDSRGAAQEDAR